MRADQPMAFSRGVTPVWLGPLTVTGVVVIRHSLSQRLADAVPISIHHFNIAKESPDFTLISRIEQFPQLA